MSKYSGRVVTDFAPAGHSVFFDGTGDYLTVPSNAALTLGTGNFCLEFWAYPTSFSATRSWLSNRNGTETNRWGIDSNTSGQFYLYGNGGFVVTSTAQTVNQWVHVCVTRAGTSSNQTRIFINGALSAVGTSSTDFAADIVSIGASPTGSQPAIGNVSNARIIKGSIPTEYTTTSTTVGAQIFSPPTQLLNVTSTSLLTCQSPTIIDQSSNAFALTVNGNAAVSTFTPFPSSYYFYNAPTDGNTRNMVPSNIAGFNPAYGAAAPGVWTLDQAQYFTANRLWPIYDPYFNLTTLMLPGNGTNGAQNNTFLDSSTNNFTITRNGNTTQGTFSPFSQTGWGNYFGGNGNYFSGTNSNFNVSSGTLVWTLEFWVYPIGTGVFFAIGNGASNGNSMTVDWNRAATNKFSFAQGNGGSYPVSIITSNTYNPNAWYHIAVSKDSSGVIRLFINGIQDGTQTFTSTVSSGTTMVVNGLNDNNGLGNSGGTAYISNLRFVTNTALYTSNFTPSTVPLTAVSGTQLLTCQSNRFVDTSSNSVSLTVVGTTSIQAFSPFAPTAAYSAATVGGSGYFDGTGDFLALTQQSLSTNDYTIECWIYATTDTSNGVIYDGNSTDLAGNGAMFVWTSGTIVFRFIGNASPTVTFSNAKINQWYHIAFSKSGTGSNNVSCYVNGSRVGQMTYTTSLSSTSGSIGTYAARNNFYFPGYISSFRVLNGTALYSGTSISIPTAPLTAITNTSLLLNYTNAGIIDATSDNVLETISTAQISTVQSRFGGSSLAFNGTSDVLRGVTGAINQFGTGDFTAEMWLYPTVFTSFKSIWCCSTSAANATGFHIGLNSSGQIFIYSASGFQVTSSNSMTLNAWNHVAVVRSGLSVRIYINGTVSTNSWTLTTQTFTDGAVVIGATPAANSEFYAGYIDDFRITRGFARYTANFVPPTSALQLQ